MNTPDKKYDAIFITFIFAAANRASIVSAMHIAPKVSFFVGESLFIRHRPVSSIL